MKKALLVLLTAVSSLAVNAQTATNFNCNDCSSTNHDLFTELDAGKVIVLCWVMPCASCINPAATASTTVQTYASSNPGQVKFYLCDDAGNTTCTTLNSWAATNGISYDASFSNNAINMNDYGGPGMPKIVVLGGSSHTVFFTQDNALNNTVFQQAIDDALAATAINDPAAAFTGITLSPNPANSFASLNYGLANEEEVTIEIFNASGMKVQQLSVGNEFAGKHEIALDLSALSKGMYFINLIAGSSSQTTKLLIAE